MKDQIEDFYADKKKDDKKQKNILKHHESMLTINQENNL